MRILVDTNVLFSALLFPYSKPADALFSIVQNHKLLLTEQNIYELREIIRRKKPALLQNVDIFLSELSFELIPSAENTEVTIRDVKDQPILNAAIKADADVILTGDKDFLSLDLTRPVCMTPAAFLITEKN